MQEDRMVPPEAPSDKTDKRFVVRYSALPGWFLPVAVGICVASGGLWLGLRTGALPDLSGLQAALHGPAERNTLEVQTAVIQATNPQSILRNNPQAPPLVDPRTNVPDFSNVLPPIIPGSTPMDKILFLLGTICIFSGLMSLVGRDTKLVMSKGGLLFPSAMMPELQFRPNRPWADISAMLVPSGQEAGKLNQKVQLYFNTGGKANIDLASMAKQDVETFFKAVDTWGTQCAVSPDIVTLRHHLEAADRSTNKSHTALWEEEMAAHYSATNFVALTPGKTLQEGRLKIVMHMSSGGLSAVYLAEHRQKVAIVKESVVPVTTDDATREKAREMFRREADLLLKLDHPNIAHVLDYFVENGRDYLVLEYIPGISLREYVKRNGKQSETQVLQWAEQIALILSYLHEREPPIVHRDLTPDNLILTPEGKLFLIDFGAANQFVGQATGTVVGKQLYISPEQFRGKAQPASDIYGLGATLHFLLTGTEPEALSTSHPASIQADLSEAIDALIAGCTAQETDERIASARQLYQEIERITGKVAASPSPSESDSEAVSISIPQYEGRER